MLQLWTGRAHRQKMPQQPPIDWVCPRRDGRGLGPRRLRFERSTPPSNDWVCPSLADAVPSRDHYARNNTTRSPVPNRATSNAIFIRGTIAGSPQLCLVDTGSEVSLVPHSIVEGLALSPCDRALMAANGSAIRVTGQITVPIEISRGFRITTNFLVSDMIVEPMLGMDWLREHRCRLGFGTGALFVGRRRIPLVKGNGNNWVRRVIVAEDVVVLAKCQQDVTARTQYSGLSAIAPAWITEPRALQPGVHVARIVVNENSELIPVRVANLTQEPVKLEKGQLLGGLHPVEIETLTVAREAPLNKANVQEKWFQDLVKEVPVEAKSRLESLISDYRDIFSVDDRDLGRTSLCAHRIDTEQAAPVREPLRRHPVEYRAKIDEEVDQMLANRTIEPAVSEWASNVVLARKKDGSLRFCIDYRRLNERTKKDSYPLPRVEDCLDALSGSTWFSTLDLRSGYHQVAMDPKDAHKTAFVTRRGIFKWKVMPFGFCNAPATFQRF